MSKKVRKVVLVGMILSTLIGSTVGCGSKEASTGESKPETTTTEVKEEATKEEPKKEEAKEDIKKPESLKFNINVGLIVEDGLNEWGKEFENKTGIKLDIQAVSVNDYSQKLELAFASGDSPDIFAVPSDKISVYASQGALADITELVEQSPIFGNMDQDLLDSVKVNGKLYGVPLEKGNGTVTYMRKDWLDQLGLAVPTTYDEFIEALRGFKTIAPDVIPFTAPGLVGNQAEMYLREFYQDASPEFVNVDGKWVDGMLQENMKAALTRMSDAYAEGLIDMEIVTNKTSTCRDKWYAGQIGTFNYWAGNWGASLEKRLQDNYPDASVVALPGIKEAEYLERVPSLIAIPSTSKNVEGTFKYFLEYMHDGAEGSILFQHGVENLHWKQEGDQIVHLPKMSKPDEIMEKAFMTPALTLSPITAENTNYVIDQRIFDTIDVLEAHGRQLLALPESKSLGKINSEILALREKTVASIVLGQATVDEGLAKYETEVKNLGIDQVLEELNANN